MRHHDFDAETFERKLTQEQDALLVDVRTAQEYDEGHLPGAVNIDIYNPDFFDRLGALDRTRPVYVYCHSGARSYSAAQALVQLGFGSVFNLQRGIMSWNGAIEQSVGVRR